jgi:Protein of unknown function (DUF3501)
MHPLTLDDLIPLDEFASQRREYFQTHRRYIDRYRRVRIGPQATVVFENRQTLWFRVQDVLRIARLEEPRAVQQELDVFNLLLPGPGQLHAALIIDCSGSAPLSEQLAPWRELADRHVGLQLGTHQHGGTVATCRPEDRCIGASHWLQFTLDPRGEGLLADLSQPAWLELTLPQYSHRSGLLADAVRQSLVDDLQLSRQGRSAA